MDEIPGDWEAFSALEGYVERLQVGGRPDRRRVLEESRSRGLALPRAAVAVAREWLRERAGVG